ncbi:MAG: methyltransferase domain-containing protein [Cyanosarcina radialis HA8281-LM2]|nr:methyltransferase domain-containing protein [Cyanosarcina radialis HA8281-LM2]
MSQTIPHLQTAPGYQVLAAAGKTVLRPGGRAATDRLLQWANFQPGETVLELASGLGTSAIALAERYDIKIVGIEADPNSVAIAQSRVRAARLSDRVQIIPGNIFQLESLPQQFDCVFAEAILTMQSPAGKAKILQGVRDCLKPGGRFLSHELTVSDRSEGIDRDLAWATRVNSMPLNESGWKEELLQAGLTVTRCQTGPMRLLEPVQLLQDEGLAGTAKLLWNVVTQPVLRDRLLTMGRVFNRHRQNLSYIILSSHRENAELRDPNGDTLKVPFRTIGTQRFDRNFLYFQA